MQGQQGFYAKHPGFGTHIMGLSGYADLVGWPDALPAGTSAPVTDFVGGWYFLLAILGALDYRRRTGKGQCIDMAQLEAGLTLLSQNVLDYTLNGRLRRRSGNRTPQAAPHGIYRCKGDERWCCIAVFTDEEWKAFCEVIGNPGWTMDEKFSTLLNRKTHESELDSLVEEWTKNYTADEVMRLMQEKGVPAGKVNTSADIHEDPQLKHRKHFWTMDHPELESLPYFGQSAVLSETPAQPRRPSPCLGEHNEYVAREILGMTETEYDALLVEGIFD